MSRPAALKELDSLGEVDVPADKLWGAQTQRSLEQAKHEKRVGPPRLSATLRRADTSPPQPATSVLLVPWTAGTSLRRLASRRYRCTASAATQIQGVMRKAKALGLPPMARPTAVRAKNTVGMAAP